MHIFREIRPLRAYLKLLNSTQNSVGLVPTMGALHEGHLSLVQASKKQNSHTVCSIYLNPAQFTNQADLIHYPRTLDKDIELLGRGGCEAVFCPSTDEMYAADPATTIDVGRTGAVLEGAFRPGHFNGVALVVSKLFNILQPQRAYFGQKDFQQFMIIEQLVHDLNFDIELVCVPIVREPDGLAMSSRNMRLTPDERKRSTILYQCLLRTREGLIQGQSFEHLQTIAKGACNQQQVDLEYLALADRNTLAPASELKDAVLLIAARVGDIRLIDNIFVTE